MVNISKWWTRRNISRHKRRKCICNTNSSSNICKCKKIMSLTLKGNKIKYTSQVREQSNNKNTTLTQLRLMNLLCQQCSRLKYVLQTTKLKLSLLKLRSRVELNRILAVSGTTRLVKAIIMPFLKQIRQLHIIQNAMNVLYKHTNTKLNQQSWWENLEPKWKKMIFILTEDRIKLSIQSLISHLRCGRDKEKKRLSTYNAEFEVGLLANLQTTWESSVMTRKKNLFAEKKSY